MPIEFSCRGCQQRLSTPDGSAGQPCQCPSCSALQTVPGQSRRVAVRQALRGSLKIPCPRCRFVLECAPSLLGTKGQCRNCQHIFTITDQTAAGSSHSPPQDEPTLVFHCPRCRQLFAGQVEMEGRKGKCHACGEVFAIELEAGPSSAAQPASNASLNSTANTPVGGGPADAPVVAGTTSQSIEVEKRSTPTRQPSPARPTAPVVASSSQPTTPIEFSCRHCAGTMEVPATAIGQPTNCPFCGTTLTIPARSEAAGWPAASSHRNSAAAVATRRQPHQLWPELQDGSGAAQANPTGAPALPPRAAPPPSQWNTRPRRKPLRGLTFANAFQMTLDSLFPYCLIAPLLFGMAMAATYVVYLALVAVAQRMVGTLELSDPNSLSMLSISVLIGTSLIGCFIVTVPYCMTCNTALHAVRGRRISPRLVFSTGDAYAGMLAILLGWTVFNLVRKYGLGFIVREMAGSVDPQTAMLVGMLLVLALSLLQIILTFLWGFVPYALLDGQSLSNALGTSMSICLNHFWTVIAVILCGWTLYVLAGILSIGLGMLLLMGFSFYMNAAMYHLAED